MHHVSSIVTKSTLLVDLRPVETKANGIPFVQASEFDRVGAPLILEVPPPVAYASKVNGENGINGLGMFEWCGLFLVRSRYNECPVITTVTFL
jgi:hypothetical protein